VSKEMDAVGKELKDGKLENIEKRKSLSEKLAEEFVKLRTFMKEEL